MKILELFAGSRSFSKEAEKLGYETFCTDIKDFENIDYVTDILEFDYNKIPFEPDCIWASPPCTSFSVASIGHHWYKDHIPKTKEAELGCMIVKKTIEIIKHYDPDSFFIENPRGKLRKLDFMQEFDRATVSYCSYGDKRMKPTDIWTNFLSHPLLTYDNRLQGWMPRPICKNRQKNNNCHHEKSARGSKTTGTQGLKNNYERAIIPPDLCKEILLSL